MNKIILTVGASCSGKSAWAAEQIHSKNINRDDIRFNMFCGGKRDWTKYKFNKTNEAIVTEISETYALNAAGRGKDIIISDTNLY